MEGKEINREKCRTGADHQATVDTYQELESRVTREDRCEVAFLTGAASPVKAMIPSKSTQADPLLRVHEGGLCRLSTEKLGREVRADNRAKGSDTSEIHKQRKVQKAQRRHKSRNAKKERTSWKN